MRSLSDLMKSHITPVRAAEAEQAYWLIQNEPNLTDSDRQFIKSKHRWLGQYGYIVN